LPLSGELLVAADEILGLEPETQATLRRAVSTAYYALFHLLIEECCKNWIRPEQRIGLGWPPELRQTVKTLLAVR
jgi:hypothetical protein